MSTTHRFLSQWSCNGVSLAGSQEVTKDGDKNFDVGPEVLTAASTPRNIDLQLVLEQMGSLYILSTVDCTLKANDDGSPTATINLKAGVPLMWVRRQGIDDNPFGAEAGTTNDVSSATLTNTSSPLAAGTFQFRCAYDYTP